MSATSNDNRIVSPCVTAYEPNAFINVDSSLKETVVVSGIDSEFDISLDEADSIKLLNGFTVSGFSVDCRLGQKDPEMTGLAVAMDGVDFKSVIEDAIGSAVNSASPGETIDKYLANQLRDAFNAAFGTYLPMEALTAAAMVLLTPTMAVKPARQNKRVRRRRTLRKTLVPERAL